MSWAADSIYLIGDPGACGDDELLPRCRRAIAAGVDAVQLRAKTHPGATLYQWAQTLRDDTAAAGVELLINDRIDVALAIEADGVHLGQRSLPPQTARELLGTDALIGASVHDMEEAEAAVAGGADYLLASPIFRTSSKPGAAPKGPQWFTRLQRQTPVPVLPLGGINAETASRLQGVCPHGAAVLSAVMAAERVSAAVTALRASLRGDGTMQEDKVGRDPT